MPLLLKTSAKRAASAHDEEPSRKKAKGLPDGIRLTHDTMVKRTAVTSKSSYLDERCDRISGWTVQACIGSLYLRGGGEQAKYTMADLRYDLKAGRLKVVTGAAAKAAVQEAAKNPVATIKEEPRQKLDIEEFFAVAQCSLRMEARHHMDHDFSLKDPKALRLWPTYEKFAQRNLGKNEKWVPWHTVLGIHEKFLVEEVHHATGDVAWWKRYNRFVAMFLFRCHCKCDLFLEVQMPHLRNKMFWKNLSAGFAAGSQMEKDMLKFRALGKALQTSCFLIIPERILEDDDKNLVRNIMLRSQRLIALANHLWSVVNDVKTSTNAKYDEIKKSILGVNMLGDTWVKMLMVCIDICFPELKLLQERCEVGVGASDPMRTMLEDEGLLEPRSAPRGPGSSIDLGDGYSVTLSISQGIVGFKRHGKQLIQVTSGMAGSFDKAHAVALELGKFAAKKKLDQKDQPILMKKRQEYFDDKAFVVANLGLDERMRELHAQKKDEKANEGSKKDRSNAGTESDASKGLKQLCDHINASTGHSAKHFWGMLGKVEEHGRKHFKHLPLMIAQMRTQRGKLSAATTQVQLCEFRQFRNYKGRQ